MRNIRITLKDGRVLNFRVEAGQTINDALAQLGTGQFGPSDQIATVTDITGGGSVNIALDRLGPATGAAGGVTDSDRDFLSGNELTDVDPVAVFLRGLGDRASTSTTAGRFRRNTFTPIKNVFDFEGLIRGLGSEELGIPPRNVVGEPAQGDILDSLGEFGDFAATTSLTDARQKASGFFDSLVGLDQSGGGQAAQGGLSQFGDLFEDPTQDQADALAVLARSALRSKIGAGTARLLNLPQGNLLSEFRAQQGQPEGIDDFVDFTQRRNRLDRFR